MEPKSGGSDGDRGAFRGGDPLNGFDEIGESDHMSSSWSVTTELPSLVTNTPTVRPKNVSEDPMRGVTIKEDKKQVLVIYTGNLLWLAPIICVDTRFGALGGTLGMKKVDGRYCSSYEAFSFSLFLLFPSSAC